MEEKTLSEMATFISSVGFPVFVAVYYMFVGHRDSKANTTAIQNMATALDNNTKTIQMLHKVDSQRTK